MRAATLIEALLMAPHDRPFITRWTAPEEYATVTFGELRRLARAHAARFQAAGVKRGDSVVLILPQDVPLIAAFAGALWIGAVPAILVYPHRKLDAEKFRHGLLGVSRNIATKAVVTDAGLPADLRDSVGAGLILYDGCDSTDIDVIPDPGGPTDIAFIQHSAGTTGLQKGVALSNAVVLQQLESLASVLAVRQRDRIYSWLPLYHDMGLIACLVLPLVYHLELVLQDPLEWVMQPATMLQLITQYRCTLAWVPNFALQFLARRVPPEDRAGLDLSSLRALINCSEPVRASSLDEFQAAYGGSGLGPNVLQASYAMAENTFAVTQTDLGAPPSRLLVDAIRLRAEHVAVEVEPNAERALCLVSSGRCLPGNSVRIVTPAGDTLPDGRVGEILVQSDSLFAGYYNRPDLTEAVLRDGWYATGDLGFLDRGELFVAGRKKDLIIAGGVNVYPEDVEAIACGHQAIHDGRAVALGLYNSELGTEDIVVAAEVEDAAALAEAPRVARQIRQAIVTELGVSVRAVYVKPPRWIVKSSAGKPARSDTRRRLLAEHPELTANGEGSEG